jgi:hypothetical protein
MSKIYKYKHDSILPITSNNRSLIVYHAFNKIYNNYPFCSAITGTNEIVSFDSSEVNGFLINNAELLQSIAIFAIGNECTLLKEVAFRKKGSVFNIKRIKHSQFMYDTKYNRRYNGEWW